MPKFKLSVAEMRALVRAAEFTSACMHELGECNHDDVHPRDSAAAKLSLFLIEYGEEVQ